MRLPDLPIVEVLDDLRAALAGGTRAVVAAPPGAGKTTVIPLALLDEPWLSGRRIVVLEPRRLATRAAARRMADLTATEVGGLVGYQTRDERRIGPTTRIEVVTEGVLTRRLQQDPELPGVGLVVFDEVHERNLTTDLGLALTLDAAATLRPDLRIVAMSATADTASFARLLGAAPIIESAGRTHPVDIRWRPRTRDERLEPAVTAAVLTALRDEDGDVLAFLPGVAEITRTAERLATADVDVHRLAGALSPDEQDRALAPSPPGRRRVVLATDIAETSLTVEGVSIVVDSGLARAPRFDVGTGMTRLTTVSISRDSADQRAGRAGRLGPGVAYRLWSRMEHGTRPAHRAAEITQVDLAGLVLELAGWGTPPDELSFLDRPPAKAWRQASELLTELGALDGDGAITPLGRRMLGLPVHPRLARMIVGRPDALSCLVAALVDERDIVRDRDASADLAMRVELVRRGDRAGSRRARARRGHRPARRHRLRPRRRRPRRRGRRVARRVPRPSRRSSPARPVPAAHRVRRVGRRRRPAGDGAVPRRRRPRRQALRRAHPPRRGGRCDRHRRRARGRRRGSPVGVGGRRARRAGRATARRAAVGRGAADSRAG